MVDQESVRPLAKSAAAKAKHTPAPGYEKVALAITGDDPPAWLVKFLKMWGPCLAVDRGVAAVKTPTRAHMRKTLEGVRAAAALILSALDDGETRGFLDAASPGTIPDRLAICRLMSDLVRRAEEGISWLVTEGGKTKAGRNRAMPPGSFPPKTYCAAIIAEAWSFVHGVEPAPKHQKAAAAAHLFWRESLEGLSMEETKLALEWMRAKDAKKSWGEPLNGWWRHFKEAKEPHVSEMRKKIRRHLTECKRQAEMFANA